MSHSTLQQYQNLARNTGIMIAATLGSAYQLLSPILIDDTEEMGHGTITNYVITGSLTLLLGLGFAYQAYRKSHEIAEDEQPGCIDTLLNSLESFSFLGCGQQLLVTAAALGDSHFDKAMVSGIISGSMLMNYAAIRTYYYFKPAGHFRSLAKAAIDTLPPPVLPAMSGLVAGSLPIVITQSVLQGLRHEYGSMAVSALVSTYQTAFFIYISYQTKQVLSTDDSRQVSHPLLTATQTFLLSNGFAYAIDAGIAALNQRPPTQLIAEGVVAGLSMSSTCILCCYRAARSPEADRYQILADAPQTHTSQASPTCTPV